MRKIVCEYGPWSVGKIDEPVVVSAVKRKKRKKKYFHLNSEQARCIRNFKRHHSQNMTDTLTHTHTDLQTHTHTHTHTNTHSLSHTHTHFLSDSETKKVSYFIFCVLCWGGGETEKFIWSKENNLAEDSNE